MTREEILHEIARQEELSAKCEESNYDMLYYSNPYDREIIRLHQLLIFVDLGVEWREGNPGLILIKDKQGKEYTYALRSGRWKVTGKNKWYYSKTPKQFIEKYVGL